MDTDDFLSALNVRNADDNLTVKASRSQQSRIQDIRTVCRGQNDDTGILSESVHLNQQLIQRLLPLVVAAAQSGASLTSHRVDLVDKHDAGRIFLGLLEQVSDTGCTDADKHFNKVGAADRKERHSRFTRCRPRHVGFSGSRRADQQDSLGDSRADLLIFPRILEEVHDLFKFLLLLLQTCDIREGNHLPVALIQSGLALSELERLAVASLIHHQIEQEAEGDHHNNGGQYLQNRTA